MEKDFEVLKQDQMRVFILEISKLIALDIPNSCLGDFENFKSLVQVKMQRLQTTIDLLGGDRLKQSEKNFK